MKKLMIITLAILTFAACKKLNNEQPTTIYGKWYLNASDITSYSNNVIIGRSDSTVTAHTYYAIFNTDGTGEEYNSVPNIPYAALLKFTYSASGTNMTLNFPQQTINGVTYDAIEVSASVITLANNDLTMVFVPAYIYGFNAAQTQTQYFAK